MKRTLLCLVAVGVLSTVPALSLACVPDGDGKRELTVYTSIQPEMLLKIESAVARALPGVKVAWFQAGTEKIMAKIAAEMEAGKVGADVLMVADPSYYVFLKSRGMLLPYKSPNATGTMGVQDPDGHYASVRIINAVLGYNSKLVRKEDAPKRFADLVEPKWKGKVGIPDPTLSGSAFDTVAALSREYGWNYYRLLNSNKVQVADGQGSLENKLVTGEVSVAAILETNILMAKNRGEPVELVYPEDGVGVFPSPVGIIRTTASPEAARAMVDWWFTREGQETVVQGWMHSVRQDVPPPKGASPLGEFIGRAFPIDWEKLSSEIGPLKEEFTRIMSE